MIIATTGMSRLSTKELMSAPKATPRTNATASSTMLPRRRKSLNSLSMGPPCRSVVEWGAGILAHMPIYQRLGRVPRKRHIQFRENGTLLTEEVMGLEGFSGNEAIAQQHSSR